jgi:hypothetical protein
MTEQLVMHTASLALMISLQSTGYVCGRQAQLRARQDPPKEGDRILTAFVRACDEDDCRHFVKQSRERDSVLQQVFAHDDTPPQTPSVADSSTLPAFSMSPTASVRDQAPLPSMKSSANPSELIINPSSAPLIASTASTGPSGVWDGFNVSLVLISGAPPVTGSPVIGSVSNTNTSSTLLFQNYSGIETTVGNEKGDGYKTNMTFHTESPIVTGGPWLSILNPSTYPSITPIGAGLTGMHSGSPADNSSSTVGANGVWAGFNVSVILNSGAIPASQTQVTGSLRPSSTPSTRSPVQNVSGIQNAPSNNNSPQLGSTGEENDYNTTVLLSSEAPAFIGGPAIGSLRPSIAPSMTVEKITGTQPGLFFNDSSIGGSSGEGGSDNTTMMLLSGTQAATGATSNCTVDRSGTYGSVAGNAADLGFFYQIETIGDVSLASVNDDIVPLIEIEISNLLLPGLFESQCASVEGLRDLNNSRRKQEATGFSSSPTDFILRGGKFFRLDASRVFSGSRLELLLNLYYGLYYEVRCVGNQDSYKNGCVVVEGRATLFSATNTDIEALLAASRISIREAMDDGILNHLHRSIVGVKFRSGTVYQSEQSTAGTGSGFERAIAENPPAYAWILICFFFGVINACFCCANRYNRRRWKTVQKRTEDVGEEYYDDGKYFLDESWARASMAPTALEATSKRRRSSVNSLLSVFSGSAGETSFQDNFQNEFQPIPTKPRLR